MSLTTPKVNNLIKKHLVKNEVVKEINRNWSGCECLKEKKESDSEELIVKLLLCCRNTTADEKRCRHNVDLESDKGED